MQVYDIAIVGGGIAGVAAAVQTARMGMKTVLIEKTALVGGLATGGLINVFLPLCDGNGHQVSFGLAEEMLRRSLKYGPGEIPPRWRDERDAAERKRFISVFSPASLVLALDELLEEAGVTVYLDTLVCAAKTAGNRLTGVAVENESGRFTLRALDEVVADEQTLKTWIFDKEKAEVIFAVADGREIGFALFFHNFSTFLGRAGIYLEDLYIMPEYRGRGYGKAMLSKLASIAVERGCGRLEWWCLDWNKPSIDFYLSQGAEAMSDWTVYRISGSRLKEMAENSLIEV